MAQNYRNQSGRSGYERGGRYQTGGEQDRYRTGGEQRFSPESNDRVHWHGGGHEGDRSYSQGGDEEYGYGRGRNRDDQSRDARNDQYQSRGSSGANYQSGLRGGDYEREGRSRYDEGRFDEANRWSEGADDVGPEDAFRRRERTTTSSWREDPYDRGGFFNTGSYVDDGGSLRGFGDDFDRARRQVQQRYGTGGGSRGQGYYGSQSGRGFEDQQRGGNRQYGGSEQSWRSQQGTDNSYQDRSSWDYGQDRGQRAGSGSTGGAYGYDAGAYRSGQSSQSHRGRGPQGYQRSDERLKELVCERLTDDPNIDASNVNIDVTGQVVKLTGTVDDRSTKYEIEELIESLGGVKDIDNQLRVQRSSSNWNQSGASQSGSNQGSSAGTASGSFTAASSSPQSRSGGEWEAGSSGQSGSTQSGTGRAGSASGTSTSSGSSTSGSTTSPSKRN